MQSLIEIGGRIINTDILTEYFCCDLAACKGMCCVEGDSGAPLESDEAAVLESEYANYSSYMTARGRQAVQEQGFAVVDEDGDLTTPLIANAECAYAVRENGITLCALEKAAKEGKMSFRKPISCHLYPIRIRKFSDGSEGLAYHRWEVCAPARINGSKCGLPVYQVLKEPIIRRFGKEFYNEMDEAAKYINDEL